MPIMLSGSEHKNDAAAAASEVTCQQDTFELHQHHLIITVTTPNS